jgi:hypothetical protein
MGTRSGFSWRSVAIMRSRGFNDFSSAFRGPPRHPSPRSGQAKCTKGRKRNNEAQHEGTKDTKNNQSKRFDPLSLPFVLFVSSWWIAVVSVPWW